MQHSFTPPSPKAPPPAIPPCAIIVMGVSGSGKSTLGRALAASADCGFLEGDDFHSPDALAAMRSGIPLTDAERAPWLDRVGAAIGEAVATDGVAIAACSALKRAYRERLIDAAQVPLLFVLLDTIPSELSRRLAARQAHYMPASLLESQLATLERPASDERAITLDAGNPTAELVSAAWAWVATTMRPA